MEVFHQIADRQEINWTDRQKAVKIRILRLSYIYDPFLDPQQ